MSFKRYLCGAAIMTYLEISGLCPSAFHPVSLKIISANLRIKVLTMDVS